MNNLARMHTAEHLLSAVMKKHFQAPRNLELHLGEKKTKCDYAVPFEISKEDIARIEAIVKQQIANDLLVSDFQVSRENANAYDLWKLPDDAVDIRIVQIGDFDAQPCSGRHVKRTSEIGVFNILSYELRNNGNLRIRFNIT